MTSRRTDWDLRENRLSAVLDEKRRQGQEILDLAASNPTEVGLRYPEREIRGAISTPGVLRYEPSPRGLESARRAVADHYAERGFAVDPEQLFLTASTSEGYGFLWKLLADPGDEVLVPRPSYPLFDYLAGLDGIVARPYRLEHDREWSIDLDSVARAIGPRARAIVVVHPNNPTGSYVDSRELEALATLAREHQLALVSDEVFAEYALGPDDARGGVVALRDDVLSFTLSGLSKLALLPQVKLAWILVGGPEASRGEVEARLEVVADTYLSVSASAQHGAESLLRIGTALRETLLARIRANLDCLRAAKAGAPEIDLLEPEGGWYAVLRLPRTRSDEEWALGLLEDDGVYVHPGSFYDFEMPAIAVLSLIVEEKVFAEGIARIVDRVRKG